MSTGRLKILKRPLVENVPLDAWDLPCISHWHFEPLFMAFLIVGARHHLDSGYNFMPFATTPTGFGSSITCGCYFKKAVNSIELLNGVAWPEHKFHQVKTLMERSETSIEHWHERGGRQLIYSLRKNMIAKRQTLVADCFPPLCPDKSYVPLGVGSRQAWTTQCRLS